MTTHSTIRIAPELTGPANSAQGGIAAGSLGELIDGPASVRLHQPPPLGRDLSVRADDGRLSAVDDGEVILSAEPADPAMPDVPEVGIDRARDAGWSTLADHAAPTCVVCGTVHERSLEIFPGPVDDGTVATVWEPPAWVDDGDGAVRPELLWGVLDCPGGWAITNAGTEGFFAALGTIAVHRRGPVAVGEPVAVLGWTLGSEGRKHHAGTAIVAPSGEVRAVGRQTCIALPQDWASG